MSEIVGVFCTECVSHSTSAETVCCTCGGPTLTAGQLLHEYLALAAISRSSKLQVAELNREVETLRILRDSTFLLVERLKETDELREQAKNMEAFLQSIRGSFDVDGYLAKLGLLKGSENTEEK